MINKMQTIQQEKASSKKNARTSLFGDPQTLGNPNMK